MTTYNLSVIQLCPDGHKVAAEQIAEAAGYGTGNLSVRLQSGSGEAWWGCHAWWVQGALENALALPAEAPTAWHEAMAAVITSVKEDADAYGHWQEVLAANGVTIVSEE
ncbi:hypothetical protein D3C85_628250 [compost metagenome]